ncbi:hypothetical protein DL96DRAFT_844730 [Flagelloscypha sp. PMI_526]|nr:hypothetical protein DL96DRAFT_844730 [Flagelloscypha sp. PMI_526]
MNKSDSRLGQGHHRLPSRVSTAPLKRGAACLNCRFYKIKCDGQRPQCTPCATHPKDDPCEYQDGPRSRSKALEDRITFLESRIFELEHPDQTPSMELLQPYRASSLPSSLGLEITKQSDLSPMSQIDAQSLGPSPTQSSPNSIQPHLDASPPVEEELPLPVVESLVDLFMPHAAEVGFFLNRPTFRAAALNTSASSGSPARPLMSLLYAVCLWGDRIRKFHDPAQTRTFEAKALRYAMSDLTNTNPQPNQTLHLIQTNVLLAYYYASLSRLSEASYFVCGATTLALSAGFNRAVDTVHDAVAYGERIDAFWTVVGLSRTIAVLVRIKGEKSLCEMLEIIGANGDVPWPLEEEEYSQGRLPERSHHQRVPSFIHGTVSPQDGGNAIRVLETKASLLLNEAVLFITRWEVEDHAPLMEAYSRLTTLYAHLHSHNKRLHYLDNLDRMAPRLLSALSMLEASGLILYNAFANSDASYRSATLKAAMSILHPGSYDVLEAPIVNPIMGFAWHKAVSTLLEELQRLHTTGQGDFDEQTIQRYIERGRNFLQHHATTNPIIREYALEGKRRSSPITSPVSPVDMFLKQQRSSSFHHSTRPSSAASDAPFANAFPVTSIDTSGIFSTRTHSPTSSMSETPSDWSNSGVAATNGSGGYGQQFIFDARHPPPALNML